MIITTTRFGVLDVPDDEIYEFPEGIPGFEQERRFVIVQVTEHEPFSYLQAVNNADLAFIVVNPFDFFQNYEVELSDVSINNLQAEAPDQMFVRSIVNISGGIASATVNLIAPIVFNSYLRRGQQVILTKEIFSTRHTLFNEARL